MTLIINGIPIEIKGGVVYSAGDGITFNGNEITVTTPTRGIVTDSEYNAFTEEQKQSGTYIIQDDAGAASSTANVYSTEEQVVGRWIDGKPIYRKVILNISGAQLNNFVLAENVDSRISLSGMLTHVSTGFIYPLPNRSGSSDYVQTKIANDIWTLTTAGNWTPYNAEAILEYTKTTDYPTIVLQTETTLEDAISIPDDETQTDMEVPE